ncbi:unnamed protein product [Cunninghamella blakesleeana]
MKSPDCIKRHLNCFQKYVILSDKSSIPKQSSKYPQVLQSTSTSTSTSLSLSLSNDNILTKKYAESIPDTLKLSNEISQKYVKHSTDLDPSFINTRYECCRPTKLDQNYNPKVVAYLSLLRKSRELESNEKSSLAYAHAISAIKAYPRIISSAAEAGKIKGVGPKIKELIHYYLKHDSIPEAEKL